MIIKLIKVDFYLFVKIPFICTYTFLFNHIFWDNTGLLTKVGS